jgi:hypothetical protein
MTLFIKGQTKVYSLIVIILHGINGVTELKFHLTKADCTLICTNSKELKFSSGQVIANEGTIIQALYR